MSLLTFKDVSYYYQDGGKRVDILSQANYRFEKGKTYGAQYAGSLPQGCCGFLPLP